MADRLRSLGDEEAAADRPLSAAEKYGRACVYYMTAERMQSRHYRPRQEAYAKMLDMADRWITLGGLPCERVDIPYEGSSFPGLLATVPGVDQPPCMVFCNGLDSVKEMIYRCGMAQELQRRGIATLMVDHPGVGEALRLRGLTAVHDSERWAGAAVDFLERDGRVDAARLGMMGWSLGGYYAPRAAAFEKRFKLCVAWGANHNWGELQKKRLAREGDRPVPHYWDHVMWVWGKETLEEFMAFAPQVSLVGVVENITVPFLITHGANDRQIPLSYAHQCYEEAVNSPKRELKIFTDREGGVEHVSADNMEPVRSYIADWIERTFASLPA
jgi:dienelactone hydrolase